MLVGVYAGELLSTEGFRRRHESRWCEKHEPGRKERLAALTHGAPIGGHFNGGSYVVALASAPGIGMAMAEGPEDVFVYIDAEDPNRSSWCRYINHAESNERECNLILQTSADQDAPGTWLIARRDIWVGEELLFDYGPRYSCRGLTCSRRTIVRRAGMRAFVGVVDDLSVSGASNRCPRRRRASDALLASDGCAP